MERNETNLNIADNLTRLRKSRGMTQEDLAKLLFVSNKTVSKWERGVGYPEITQLLRLANVFGVTVDSLMRQEHAGIAFAGNIITDTVKITDTYPEKGMLAQVFSVSRAVGGCAPNTAIDLVVIDRTLPVSVYGRVGDDEPGRFHTSELQKYGIDVSGVLVTEGIATSFSDVMSVQSTGERTFFHHAGANAVFAPEDVPVEFLRCRMLHAGYILLLEQFDRPDPEYGTAMARFLKTVQDAGIRTSFDVVSDSGDRFGEKVLPALRYTDNAIMNEIECCGVARLAPRYADGSVCVANVRAAMEQMMSHGVSERVIVHCPEAGFILNRSGEFTVVPSLRLPEGHIKGAVGAGDAFCAGCLYGIYHGFTDEEILAFASATAACSLTAEDSVSGMRPKEDVCALMNTLTRLPMPR